MSCAMMKAALYAQDRALTPIAKLVLIYLCDRANAASFCWPSAETIAADIACSVRSIGAAIAQLEDRDFIRVHRRRRQSSVYHVLPIEAAPPRDVPAIEVIGGEASVVANATVQCVTLTEELIGDSCLSRPEGVLDHEEVDRQNLLFNDPVDRQILPTESLKKESPKKESLDQPYESKPARPRRSPHEGMIMINGAWVDEPKAVPVNPGIARLNAMGSPDRTGTASINGFDVDWTTEEACLVARARDRTRSRMQVARWLEAHVTPEAILAVLARIARKANYRPPESLGYFGRSEVIMAMMRDEVSRNRLEAIAI